MRSTSARTLNKCWLASRAARVRDVLGRHIVGVAETRRTVSGIFLHDAIDVRAPHPITSPSAKAARTARQPSPTWRQGRWGVSRLLS